MLPAVAAPGVGGHRCNGLCDDWKMDVMASSNKQSTPESQVVQRSEELVDRFLDAIWMERGLSKNTLGAYRADLMTLGRGLSEHNKTIEQADKADLLSASISVAMNTTAFGLMCAIPLLLVHALLQTKTAQIVDSLEMASVKFLNAVTERQLNTGA